MLWITFISCVISTIVMPSSLLILFNSLRIAFVVLGSSALVDSSLSKIDGSVAKALAIPTLCFWPPESLDGYTSFLSVSSTYSKTSCTFFFIWSFGTWFKTSGNAIFSYTVFVSRRLNCWKIIPIFFLFWRSFDCFSAFISSPSTKTFPDVGTSSALIVRIKVDLPAPEKPIIPYISPSSIVRLTFSSAFTSHSFVLKILLTFWNSIMKPSPPALFWTEKFNIVLCLFSFLLIESIANSEMKC